MDVNSWVGVLSAATVVTATIWQIARDVGKDRDDQEKAALDEAVRQALLEERLRQLEERGRDDDVE